jgi:hypothetical protein
MFFSGLTGLEPDDKGEGMLLLSSIPNLAGVES